jgi:hypothetical protein
MRRAGKIRWKRRAEMKKMIIMAALAAALLTTSAVSCSKLAQIERKLGIKVAFR